ncbi:MAG: glycosyltransferase family 39 protein [Tannerellaceae bacterium]|jgi:hypothetical protein|nr:glycosyltransferase family 39 protein [Tannerellaceae bacterium]
MISPSENHAGVSTDHPYPHAGHTNPGIAQLKYPLSLHPSSRKTGSAPIRDTVDTAATDTVSQVELIINNTTILIKPMNKKPMSSCIKAITTEKNILLIIILYGILKTLVQFLANRSLWVDEAALALNIIHRSIPELLHPLDYAQSAPPLFLLIEKLFSTLIPSSEYGLRLFPMLCFQASLLMFAALVRKARNGSAYTVVAVLLFAASHIFCRFSSELKPYMTDLFVLTSIFYLTVKDYNKPSARYYSLGLAGVIAIFLTNASPVILATSGLYLYRKLIGKSIGKERLQQFRPLGAVFFVWSVAAALYYIYFVHAHPLKDWMIQYWQSLNGFLLLNPAHADFLPTIENVLVSMFSPLFSLDALRWRTYQGADAILWSAIIVFGGLYIFGIIRIIKLRHIDMLILACLPVALHLVLSVMQFYPVERRIILYTFPGMICVWTYAIQYLIEQTRATRLRFIRLSPLFILAITLAVKFPVRFVETKALLRTIEQLDRSATINIWCLPTTLMPIRYYLDIGSIGSRINILNNSDLDHQSLSQLMLSGFGNTLLPSETGNTPDTFSGRIWFLFTSLEPAYSESFLAWLTASGCETLHYHRENGAWAFLCDFGNRQ